MLVSLYTFPDISEHTDLFNLSAHSLSVLTFRFLIENKKANNYLQNDHSNIGF